MAAKPCLLVVDDEPDLVQSVKDLLRFEFRVLGATRAAEGLKIASNEPVQVVMTDQRMPEMTGVEFLACLRDRQPETVRLLFTAYSDLQAVMDAINKGNVYRYITKPFQADELKAVLRQAVDHYNLQAERNQLLKEVQEKNALLEKANQELLQANDLKRAFIKVASHELRTPLTIVCGLAELAASGSQAGEGSVGTLLNWMGQIHQASQRLRERVDQMVEFLQTETFARPLAPREVDLAVLISAACEEVRSFIQRRKHQLHRDVPGDLGTVVVEPDKIHDSIVQLLVNAIKFTPDGGDLFVSARRVGDEAVITVRDTGTGIEPECLPRIFDPFFTRFDVSHHRSGSYEFNRRGLGLGLPVAKAFVEMHGGKLEVVSDVGRGTTVTITLPTVPV